MQKTQNKDVQDVSMSDVLGLASWDRERSSEELQSFVERRQQLVGGELEVDM